MGFFSLFKKFVVCSTWLRIHPEEIVETIILYGSLEDIMKFHRGLCIHAS